MWNKILTSISIIAIITTFIFMYLYNNEKQITNNLSITNNRYQNELVFKDSINNILINTNNELESANKTYQTTITNINSQLVKIEQELIDKKLELKNMSIDSIAAYIVLNYLGDVYKVQKINDSTFVAFQEITVRDIANQKEEFKTLFKRSEQLSNKIDSQDTLIKIQAKKISILTNTMDTVLQRYNLLNIDLKESQNKVVDLTNEVDKQKGLKRIGFITSGGLLLILLIVL